MGKLRACFVIASLALVAACGSDSAKPDASIKIIDAPPDSPKVWEDAPPVTYDLSCLNAAAPTTAPDPITVAGSTQTLSQGGAQPLPNVDVDVFKVSSNTPLATTTSSSTGAFTTSVATGGASLDGYIRAMEPAYRTTYMYPGTKVGASLAGVPVVLISDALFDQLGSNFGQDDSTSGAMLVAITDCSATPTPIAGATVTAMQGTSSVGTVFDLSQIAPQAAGTFFVFNVPDGETQVLASYNGMAFPARTVRAYKKPAGQGAEGTLTAVQIKPSN